MIRKWSLGVLFEEEQQPFWFTLRIVIGVSLFVEYLKIFPVVAMGFYKTGVGGIDFLNQSGSSLNIGRPLVVWNQYLHWVTSDQIVAALFYLLLFSALLFALNIWTRVSGVILLTLHFLFHARNEFFFWGWADMVKPFLIYTLMNPLVNQPWGLEQRGRSLKIYRFLILSHTVILYWVVGISRLDNPSWMDGSALHHVLLDAQFSRFPELFHSVSLAWLAPMTWFFWGIELTAPLGLLVRRTRLYYVGTLILMHIGLEVFTMVGWWNYLMIAILLNGLSEKDWEKFKCLVKKITGLSLRDPLLKIKVIS